MRRLICICALLGRLSGQGYVWRARPLSRPVAIEWQLPAGGIGGTTQAWWIAA
jgi:hypothetical protein